MAYLDLRARLKAGLTAAFVALPIFPAQAAGDAVRRGRALIQTFGCGACHQIPGVPQANGYVGPPLDHIARRVYLGGYLPNSPGNLAAWVLDPQRYAPGSAMPAVGLTPQQAQDVAAYLQTLR